MQETVEQVLSGLTENQRKVMTTPNENIFSPGAITMDELYDMSEKGLVKDYDGRTGEARFVYLTDFGGFIRHLYKIHSE